MLTKEQINKMIALLSPLRAPDIKQEKIPVAQRITTFTTGFQALSATLNREDKVALFEVSCAYLQPFENGETDIVETGDTLLHCLAALETDENTMNFFIRQMQYAGFDFNTTNAMEETALIIAVKKNNIEMVRLLLKLGRGYVNLNYQDSKGNTALHYALDSGDPKKGLDILKLLLERNTDVNIANRLGGTPLHFVATKEDDKMMQALCDVEGINLNKQNNRDYGGNTPLHILADRGEEKKYNFLVSKGARTNIVNAAGQTPEQLLHAKKQKWKTQSKQADTTHARISKTRWSLFSDIAPLSDNKASSQTQQGPSDYGAKQSKQ